MYIIFEGVIGTGKTTQSKMYYEYLRNKFPNKNIIWTREPGGTEIAEVIRNTVQGTVFQEEMEYVCEAYLYAASRAQALRKVVKPVLENGGIVISDRSFITSLTNQAFGRKLGLEYVWEINKHAVGEFLPDKVVYLDIPIKIGMQRAFDNKGDKFESLGEDFYEDVYQGYKEVQKMGIFEGKWVNIDARGSVEEVHKLIIEQIG
jgi:dTMP kinase